LVLARAASVRYVCQMTNEMVVTRVALAGRHVRLEPLTREHIPDLSEVGLDEELWRWIPVPVQTSEQMAEYVETALKDQAAGTALPFVQTDAATGRVIGSTRYANIERAHYRVEIGWTWIARDWQRTGVNTEAKYLLLKHAFETLGCNRVELKTDALNAKSRAAISRIGGQQEGIFRKHMITSSGRFRDTVYFSILNTEWPDVKGRLEQRML